MTPLLVDSNILLDIFEDDAQWADWSETTLAHYATSHAPTITPIIYAEVSPVLRIWKPPWPAAASLFCHSEY